MEENNNEKKPIVEIICFSVLIFGIISYFIYDMYIKRARTNKTFEITTNNITININEIKDIKDYIDLINIELAEMIFTISDENIINMEDKSIIVPKNPGKATITAKYKDLVKNLTINVESIQSSDKIAENKISDFDLYFLQAENESKNMLYSPLSIKYALEMLKMGADGNSRTQIINVIPDLKFTNYKNTKNISFANALFVKNLYKNNIKKDYINNIKKQYMAEVIYDSFETPNVLNEWISRKTFNLINNLFSDVSKDDFILINALAINMEWKNAIQNFKNNSNVSYMHENYGRDILSINTNSYTPLSFNGNKEVNSVELMTLINRYDIIGDLGEENIKKTVGAAYDEWLITNKGVIDDTQSNKETYLEQYIKDISDNYKKIYNSTDFSFYNDQEIKIFSKELKEYSETALEYIAIMPKKTTLINYIKNLTPEKITTDVDKLEKIKLENFKEGVVTKIVGLIPLFKFEYELKLMDELKKMGVTDVFDSNKANLSNITVGEAYINKATHKANIEFSNEGIKASAVTVLEGMKSIVQQFDYKYDVPVEEIDITFNNPYLFLIKDKNTEEIWFIGNVYEPEIYQPHSQDE